MDKPCIKCKWCNWPSMATGTPEAVEAFATCRHPEMPKRMSRVVGETYHSCTIIRAVPADCGPDGRLFEARKGATGA